MERLAVESRRSLVCHPTVAQHRVAYPAPQRGNLEHGSPGTEEIVELANAERVDSEVGTDAVAKIGTAFVDQVADQLTHPTPGEGKTSHFTPSRILSLRECHIPGIKL